MLDLEILEKTNLDVDESDDNPMAHYAKAAKVTEAYVMGNPIVALCGKVFIPFRNPEKLPICPVCKELMDVLFLNSD